LGKQLRYAGCLIAFEDPSNWLGEMVVSACKLAFFKANDIKIYDINNFIFSKCVKAFPAAQSAKIKDVHYNKSGKSMIDCIIY
jgi:hypothetical protein